MIYLPDVGVSRQPRRLSMVVLPLPEGPISDMCAPFSMDMFIFFRAGISISPTLYILLIFSNSIILSAI